MIKKLAICILSLFMGYPLYAQVMEDDFETNQYGWTETMGKRGLAVIRDGVIISKVKETH